VQWDSDDWKNVNSMLEIHGEEDEKAAAS